MNFLSQYLRPQHHGMGQAEAGYGMGHVRDGSRFPLDYQAYMQQTGQMQQGPSFGQGNHGKGLAGIMSQQGPDNTIMPVPMPQTGGQMPPMQQMPGNGGALPPQQPQGLRGLMDWARLMGGRSY